MMVLIYRERIMLSKTKILNGIMRHHSQSVAMSTFSRGLLIPYIADPTVYIVRTYYIGHWGYLLDWEWNGCDLNAKLSNCNPTENQQPGIRPIQIFKFMVHPARNRIVHVILVQISIDHYSRFTTLWPRCFTPIDSLYIFSTHEICCQTVWSILRVDIRNPNKCTTEEKLLSRLNFGHIPQSSVWHSVRRGCVNDYRVRIRIGPPFLCGIYAKKVSWRLSNRTFCRL